LLQEKYHSKQIRKELKEKKESIINPKAEDFSDTNDDVQEIIENAIEEAEETPPTAPSSEPSSETKSPKEELPE
jgi:hypothetical protein